jgi:hypothetical protein
MAKEVNRDNPVFMMNLYPIFGPWMRKFSLLRKIVLPKNYGMILFIATLVVNGESIEAAN